MNAMTIATTAPSISSSAVLVEFSVSCWTGRKLDKKASNDVTDSNGAARGVAKVSKKLLGDCAELDAVNKFAANARNTHYAMTMPWSDLGMRLCPTSVYMSKYNVTMGELQDEFARLVTVFLDAYDWELQNAQLNTTLGGLFNADEYPTRDSLESKFRMRFNAVPLPDSGDWRLDIGNQAATEMRTQYEKFYNEQLGKAMGDVWRRAHDALSKMSDRLDYADKDTKKVFRDSLVENVTDIIEMMASCNITNDPVMAKAQRDLDYALRGVTPDALREDAYLRAETKRQVDEVKRVIDSLPSLGF
jgi:hypothetical protein